MTRPNSEMKFKKLNIYLVLVEKLPVLKTVYSIPLNVVFVFDAFALYSTCFSLVAGIDPGYSSSLTQLRPHWADMCIKIISFTLNFKSEVLVENKARI